ncbi:MAG: dihydrodipicolinate synthase family protein, partial [Alphaproteobacteria bacterium]
MEPLTAGDIRGVWATVLLRVAADNRIDLSCLEEQVDACAAAGVDGVYTNGTATEFHCQSDETFRDISRRVAHRCREHDLPFQIGASHPLPVAAIERVAFARSLVPGAIQIILPDWTSLDVATAQRFLLRCTEEAEGIGLVLYNPPHAK